MEKTHENSRSNQYQKFVEYVATQMVRVHPAQQNRTLPRKLALSQHQVEVLSNCLEDSELSKLMIIVGRLDRTMFRYHVLNPLIIAGLIEMTIPDKPISSL